MLNAKLQIQILLCQSSWYPINPRDFLQAAHVTLHFAKWKTTNIDFLPVVVWWWVHQSWLLFPSTSFSAPAQICFCFPTQYTQYRDPCWLALFFNQDMPTQLQRFSKSTMDIFLIFREIHYYDQARSQIFFLTSITSKLFIYSKCLDAFILLTLFYSFIITSC